MTSSLTRRGALALLGSAPLGVLAAAACNRSPANGVAVGSKDFTEELILGEMYAQLLEKNGLSVRRRLNLG